MTQGMRGYEINCDALDLEIKSQARTKAGVGRVIGRDGGYIQGLCKGKATLSPELVQPLCEFLKMDENELLARPRAVQDREILEWFDERGRKAGRRSEDAAYGGPRKKCPTCKGDGWVEKS